MNTKKFRTKTEFIPCDNGRVSGAWEIAIDIGYSAVKLFSPCQIACFPSYATRVEPDFQFVGKEPPSAILYKDLNSNQLWIVGEVAQNLIQTGDTSDSEAILYGRVRYDNPMFRVIMETGLALGLMGNEYGSMQAGDEIVIQTGLPQKYMNDTSAIQEAFAEEHHFALKVGDGEWTTFSPKLKKENIYVMSQPRGTLFSTCMTKNGNFHPDAKKYLSSSVIVFDPGFGTLDVYPIFSGVAQQGETFTDLGMKRVLQETSKAIRDEYGIHVPVPAMQKHLETGTVKYFDRKNFIGKEVPFDTMLAKASNKVCEDAINRLSGAFSLIDYQYLIVTGGTGAAWIRNIEERFKGLTTLTLIRGNQNDEQLSFIYGNVRGYFYYRKNKLQRERV